MSIKAAFFDIDGTLVGFNIHKASEEDLKALELARAKGIKIYIATGRPRKAINNFFFPVDGVICSNGSIAFLAKDGPHPIQDWDKFECIARKPFAQEIKKGILDILQANKIPAMISLGDDVAVNMLPDIIETGLKEINFPRPDLLSIEELLSKDLFEITPFITPEDEQLFEEFRYGFVSTRWHPEFADFNMAGVSKALGLQNICEKTGLSQEEIIAFGDGGNDLPMIKYAGIGVAMGNANEYIKSCADFVTLPVEENGVSYAFHALGII